MDYLHPEPHAPTALNVTVAATRRRQVRRSALALKAAETGKVDAIREVGDRLDGKVAQALVGDDGSDPITLRTIVTGVRRAGDKPPQ